MSRETDSRRRRSILKRVAAGLGSVSATNIVSARPGSEPSLDVTQVLRSQTVQGIVDELPNISIERSSVSASVYEVRGDRIDSMTIPTSAGDLVYAEGERDGTRESAANLVLESGRVQAELARRYGRAVLHSEVYLASQAGETTLIRGPTEREERHIRRAIDAGRDELEAFTTGDSETFHVFTYTDTRSTRTTQGQGRGKAITGIEKYAVSPPNEEASEWHRVPTVQQSCDLSCMQCILGLTVSTAGIAGCFVGNWILCASGLVAGGIITAVKCPDCYDCVT
ncbi:hypothetical protein [Haloarchaeobius sp. HRN-SO-5]|uniref:hypothetical protein n=1 Tax=Haloarchaeobius sp. HRN-SO-5 TaxID=3446118 RepID=UPI003EBCE5FF